MAELNIDELEKELTRHKALESICREAGEVDGATAHLSTVRALIKALSLARANKAN